MRKRNELVSKRNVVRFEKQRNMPKWVSKSNDTFEMNVIVSKAGCHGYNMEHELLKMIVAMDIPSPESVAMEWRVLTI